MKYWLIVLVSWIAIGSSFGQTRKPKPAVKDSMSSEAFLKMVDETLNAFYADYANQNNYNEIINALEYEGNDVPDFSDEIYCQRLKKINETSSFRLDCNPITLSMIRFFAKNRRSFAKICLGRSALYFEMYEAALNKYDLPKELKYLSVIESGLRPQVKSPAGALGLWQFMYGTGKMYGLKDNSYMDERMDPVKSTDAACRYLKKLYDIYGDWNLALAAYNAGPGNINKAIRRSGGKRTYWEIRPFLPRETQGYVPNFIAATYLLTYHAEHNIAPAPAKTHFYQLDTMCLRQGVHMATISKLIDWSVEDIKLFNPVFKAQYIPYTEPNVCIFGPLEKIGKLVSLEDSLFTLEELTWGNPNKLTPQLPAEVDIPGEDTVAEGAPVETVIYKSHKVRSGETLTKLSKKYNVTSSEIMKVNKLRSANIPVGKVLKIPQRTTTTTAIPVKSPPPVPVTTTSPAVKDATVYDTTLVIYHSVQRNESLNVIAGKYNVTVEDLKAWNNLKDNWLNIGQKLKVLTVIKMTRESITPTTKAVPEVIVSTPKVATPKPAPHQFYNVKSGDLFNRIAVKHNLSVAELQKLNPGVRPDRIAVGQKIRIK